MVSEVEDNRSSRWSIRIPRYDEERLEEDQPSMPRRQGHEMLSLQRLILSAGLNDNGGLKNQFPLE